MRVKDGCLRLHLFLDTSSLEVFAANGESVLTDLILPTSSRRQLEVFAGRDADRLRVRSLEVWELSRAWR